MTNYEERLFDLLESKAFEMLSAEEYTFVLYHLTKEEYCAQHKVFSNSPLITYTVPLVAPIKSHKTSNVLAITIPLYQALIGIAAVFVGAILLRPTTVSPDRLSSAVKPTVLIKYRNLFVHDTLIQKNEVVVYKKTPDQNAVLPVSQEVPTYVNMDRDLEASAVQTIPQFRMQDIQTTGLSMGEEMPNR
jgi:hypothetical protein